MKRLAILTALFLAACALYAQDSTAQGATGGSASAAAPAADWFWGKPLASVKWEGIVHADKRELESAVKPYVGKDFTEALWMDLQSRLYELDWFDKIEPVVIDGDGTKSQVVIKIAVTEKPAIEAVRVTGNSGVKSSDIIDAVSEKAGDIYNQAKSRVDELAVRRLYLEHGFPDATVSSNTAIGKAKNGIILNFNVSEGSQVAVREIRFSGNTAVSSQTLKGKLSLKENGFLQAGTFQEAKLEDDKKAILDYYQSRGYVDASIEDVVRSYEKDPKNSKTWLILTIVVKEGKQWLFGGVSFEGNTIFDTAKLLSFFGDKNGAVLNYKKIQQEKGKIDDLYYESGYIFNEISLGEARDDEKQTIAYSIRIVERDRAHIESIAFKGNKKTKDFVLYRELPLEVGDIFSKAKVMDGLRSLYNLQYFSAIDPQMFPGSAENLMNLVISVEEQSTADIQFGVTLSGLGEPDTFPLSGLVKWDDRNFLGNGTDFSVEANVSPTKQTLTFGYSDRYFFGKRFSGGVDLSFAHKTLTTGQDSIAPIFEDGVPDPFTSPSSSSGGYSLSSIPSAYLMPYQYWDIALGFSTGYVKHTALGDLGTGGAISFGLGMKDYDSDRYRPASSSLRENEGEWLLGNKAIARVYLNNLDLSYSPSKGYYASERLTWAGFLPLETQQYLKTDTKLEGYATLFSLPVFENWNFKAVLGAHTGYAALLKKPGSDFKVDDDWLYVDGVFNARGWDELYGFEGVGLWDNWLELRLPIFEQFVWLDGFLDAAAIRTQSGYVDVAADTLATDSSKKALGSLGWDNVAMSMGFGFRFSIQQFPFRFYFAKRFTFDGSQINWKTTGAPELVISVTQALN
jgi:outer membrane protein insertion porin family